MKQDHGRFSRRRFLGSGLAGTALLFAPSFLGGCGGSPGKLPVLSPGKAGWNEAFGLDEALARRVLERAMGTGADFADLYFQYRRSNYVGLQDGIVDRAYADVELGCGIRVVKGDQTGFAFSEDLHAEALLAAASTAASVASGSAAPIPAVLTRPEAAPTRYPVQVPWSSVGIDLKVPLVQSTQEVARKADSRIAKVSVFLGDISERVLMATSEGLFVDDERPMAEVYVSCVAEKAGRRESNGHSLGARQGFEFFTSERLAQVALTAVQRTVVLFEAAAPPPGEYPIVLAPGLSGILLHEAMGHGFEADFNRKGTSVYSDKLGKAVAPSMVTIVDDGTNIGERGALNIDDEGVPAERTVLVDQGVLTSYLHDRISAKHYGVKPTGNGRRESYQHPPVPRMRNTYMTAGPHDPEEILRSVKKGLYAETFLNGQVDIGAGDFSFYLANGWLIEDGKKTRPVKDANLIGFGPKVLEQVQMVGTDPQLYSGTGMCGKDGQRVPVGFGLPTLKCAAISVGGA
ncbi:MAG: TldD/PmbA family protein [Myxococcota bacterium]|nr:TldD/PmbA family protein [Myxococcota bacterium]